MVVSKHYQNASIVASFSAAVNYKRIRRSVRGFQDEA